MADRDAGAFVRRAGNPIVQDVGGKVFSMIGMNLLTADRVKTIILLI